MASLTTYSPKDVLVTIGGLHVVTGYTDGTFIRVRKDSKPVSKIRAMDGSVGRVYSPDTSWTFELTVMQSSATNDLLSAIWNLDQQTHTGKFPVMIRDTRGSTLFMAATAWVEDIPELVFSNSMESRTWMIGCSEVLLNIGGSGDLGLEGALGLAAGSLPLLDAFSVF